MAPQTMKFTLRRHTAEHHHAAQRDRGKNHDPGRADKKELTNWPRLKNGRLITVGGLTRQAALERILADTGTRIEWRDSQAAAKIMYGRFEGTKSEVIGRLLEGTSYTAVFTADGLSLLRIVVTGAKTGTSPPRLQTASRPKSISSREAETTKRRENVRTLILKRMQADAETVREKIAKLPPSHPPIRTQAVRLTTSQNGNAPRFIGIPLYP